MKSGVKILAIPLLIGASGLQAYPMDPNKLPVSDVDLSRVSNPYTLAYDSEDPNIVYYAPRAGRLAELNGQPILGFAVAANGYGFLNAQLTFSSSGEEIDDLLYAIRSKGYTPRVFPFVRTKIKPLVPGIDPETGDQVCASYTDPVTGEEIEECDATLYESIKFSRQGPSMQSNIAISASLNPFGAVLYKNFLRSGNALQINLETLYYKAGDGFTAQVVVDYNKLLQNFHTFASYHNGYCVDIQVETFFKREGLCVDRDPEDCGLFLTVKNSRGDTIPTLTLPPNMSEEEFYAAIDDPTLENPPAEISNAAIVWQAVERLMQTIRDDMLTPIGQRLDEPDTEPSYGFKLDAKFEQQVKDVVGTFTFSSPNGVNYGTSVIPSGIGCVIVEDSGKVARDLTGDCYGYWDGTVQFGRVLDNQY